MEKENKMADMLSPKTRSAAKDYSSVDSGNFMGGVAPAAAPMSDPRTGVTGTGPSEVIQGIYVQPEAGRNK